MPAERRLDLVQELQESVYRKGYDYWSASPHLKHRGLNEGLLTQLRAVLNGLLSRGLPLRVLEIGAGDGAFVGPLLSYGCSVTATEMSRPALARLQEVYGHNPTFAAVFDPGGSLEPIEDEGFSLVLFASVLHHIPDYLSAIRAALSHLSHGGAFVSLQDPLWYPSMPLGVHVLSEAAFLAWRLGQGNLWRGVRSRTRRMRRAYHDDEPSDMVEYHVVRQGVEQAAIASQLRPRFGTVDILRYWSTPSRPLQTVGQRLALHNTFAVIATGHEPARKACGDSSS